MSPMHLSKISVDVLIIGSGIIGLSTGIALLENNPRLRVAIADKEHEIGLHASGRNSGVIHAGFYYSPNSLKAKFCRDGNSELRSLIKEFQLPILNCGKIVVAQNNDENLRLDGLLDRGIANGIDLELIDASKLSQFEPMARTVDRFLYSPNTAVSNPFAILDAMRRKFETMGGKIYLSKTVRIVALGGEIRDANNVFEAKHFINAAGSHSESLAHSVGIGAEFGIVPFLGLYRYTTHNLLPLRMLVYPVPHQINPFLGVHFTLTLNNQIKIGPSAIPILGREQYDFFSRVNLVDAIYVMKNYWSLSRGDSHSLISMISTELPNVLQKIIVKKSSSLVPEAGHVKIWNKKPPGIRAQLIEKSTGKLVQDFVIRHKFNSTHILNSVSPGWTSAIPFGRHIAEIPRL